LPNNHGLEFYQVLQMGPLGIVLHLSSFLAPALAVALVVALMARVVFAQQAAGRAWWVPVAINLIVGVLVLAAGAWYFGVDGKMVTYAALVIAIGTSQWVCIRGWRG
jgi:hypothetical protein